jgi:hypothetical protein
MNIIPKWSTGICLIMIVVTACFLKVCREPKKQAEETAKNVYKGAKVLVGDAYKGTKVLVSDTQSAMEGVGEELGAIMQLRPKVFQSSFISFDNPQKISEWVVYSWEYHQNYSMEDKKYYSSYALKSSKSYVAKYGIDLSCTSTNPSAVSIKYETNNTNYPDKTVIYFNYPKPKLLSLTPITNSFKWEKTENGWIHKVSDEDRQRFINLMEQSAYNEAATNTECLERTALEIEKRMKNISDNRPATNPVVILPQILE